MDIANAKILLERSVSSKRKRFAPEMKDSQFFEYFCAECILYPMNLGADEIRNGVVDGSGDGGIDSFYIFLNDNLLIDKKLRLNKNTNKIDIHVIQSKYTDGFKPTPIVTLKDSIKAIFNLTIDSVGLRKYFRASMISKVLDLRHAMEETESTSCEINIHIYYCTKGEAPSELQSDKAAELVSEIKHLIGSCNCEFHFLGAIELHRLAQKLLIVPDGTLNIYGTPIETQDNCIVALVSLSEYYKFIDDGGEINYKLFDANVRDYQGKSNEVNQEIAGTLDSSGSEDFWWLNNGISILCTKAERRVSKLKLIEPQVVNGLQTSFEIHGYFNRRPKDETDDRKLLVRIIELEDDKKESRDKVIKATNSQTKIPSEYLRSTDQVHRNIEGYFLDNKLYYDRRKSYYSNQQKPLSKIVSIIELAQSVAAIMYAEPSDAVANPSDYIKEMNKYSRIFNGKSMPTYLNCILAVKVCEKYISDKETVYDMEKFTLHFAYVTCALASRASKPSDRAVSSLDLQKLDKDVIDTAYRIVHSEVDRRSRAGHDIYSLSSSRDLQSALLNSVIKNII